MLRVIVFPGPANWPLFIAQDKGLFAENGLSVTIVPTPDSKFQMVGLIDGQFEIAMTAIDNVVAYSEGQGAAPTQTEPDIVSFMAVDNGLLNLVSGAQFPRLSDLRGRKVGVDALTTGYAFVLRDILERGGISADDVTFVQCGGTASRFEALMKGDIAATLLNSPLDLVAETKGLHRLANASEELGAYQGAVGAARRPWANENKSKVVAFIRSYRAAIAWLCDPANKNEAFSILKDNFANATDFLVDATYANFTNRTRGFSRDLAFDRDAISTVLALRTKYISPNQPLSDPATYIDESYLMAASS